MLETTNTQSILEYEYDMCISITIQCDQHLRKILQCTPQWKLVLCDHNWNWLCTSCYPARIGNTPVCAAGVTIAIWILSVPYFVIYIWQ